MPGMFSGNLEYLSNFSRYPVFYDNLLFPTVENAFQAAKTTDWQARVAFIDLSPGQAKRLGRQVDLRPDWEAVKLHTMRKLLLLKAAGSPQLVDLLLFSGDQLLVETNTWHDNEWGDCLCGAARCAAPGRNLLGNSWMWLRHYLSGA